jgi:hypothetical protein
MSTIESLEKLFLDLENKLTLKSDYTAEMEVLNGIESDLSVLRHLSIGGEYLKRINYLFEHANRLKKWIGGRTLEAQL